MFDFIEDTFDSLVDTASDFARDPIKTTVNIATQPIRDWLDIIDGLTEWELRTKAIARLWVDVAWWMALSELIESYKNN